MAFPGLTEVLGMDLPPCKGKLVLLGVVGFSSLLIENCTKYKGHERMQTVVSLDELKGNK